MAHCVHPKSLRTRPDLGQRVRLSHKQMISACMLSEAFQHTLPITPRSAMSRHHRSRMHGMWRCWVPVFTGP